jgi:ribosomal protein S18 acetylase RimI-like enzyme
LAIATEGQRQGVGRKLVQKMFEQAKALKKRHLVLDVEVSNIAAIRFYQSQGFIEDSVNKGFIRFSRKAL